LFILSETTSPTRVLRDGAPVGIRQRRRLRIRSSLRLHRRLSILLGHNLFLLRFFHAFWKAPSQFGPHPGVAISNGSVVRAAALLLQTQMQSLLAQISPLRQQFVGAHFDNLFNLHDSLGRCNVVPAQEFWFARAFVCGNRNDSRATDSGTPSSSNKILPGRTVATQYSGWPLPFPCASPADARSLICPEKIRIHNLPLRFMLRVNATRAASICVFVIHARSSVCNRTRQNQFASCAKPFPCGFPAGTCDTSLVSALTA